MKSSIILKAEITDLATKMIATANDSTLRVEQKAAKMRADNAALEALQEELADVKSVEAQLNLFRGAGISGDQGGGGKSSQQFYGTKSVGAAPSILPDADQMHELHEAVLSRKSISLSIKTATDVSGQLPATLVPGVVGVRHEPTRVLDFMPSAPIGTPSWEYIQHASTTGTMTTVAPGGLKPELSFVTQTLTATVRKIAAHTAVEDETLMDFSGFSGYVSEELHRIYIDTENQQLLNGGGTGTDILGLLNTTGILTRDHAADVTADATQTGLDTLEEAVTQLRVGAAFARADLIVMHPTTWSKLRRTKDSQGRYIVNPDPTMGEAYALWGIPVLTTTSIAVGTALVAQLALGAEARIRQNVTIESTPYNNDDFTHNLTRFRIEARLGLAVPRPTAILKVVGL